MKVNQINRVIHIEQPGPPAVLKYQAVDLKEPGAHEVIISQKAIGVNFVDVFFRNGTFPMPAYPAPIGLEAAGIIETIGSGVAGFTTGDRVAYYGSPGAYAEKRTIAATEIFKLPDDISFKQAASVMVKGLTAHMLLKQSHKVRQGELILIHAMTGGVGTLLSEWARQLGAVVIGTVGNNIKKQLALQRGFEHVIDLQSEDLAKQVGIITAGKGVDAVYDGTGKFTFETSLKLIKEGGSAVLYGWPSGMPQVDEAWIEQRNIRFVRAVLNDYPHYRDRSGKALDEVFALIRNGVLQLEKPSVYLLGDAAKAHADLESRKTTGSLVLEP
jgi:NADPH2:quinone reductase